MSYNFTINLETYSYMIDIDPVALYGYFEHIVQGDERAGGLWFEKVSHECPAGFYIDLVDYDGVFALPIQVIYALREAGYHVDEIFE
jgi:hypothetical protein